MTKVEVNVYSDSELELEDVHDEVDALDELDPVYCDRCGDEIEDEKEDHNL